MASLVRVVFGRVGSSLLNANSAQSVGLRCISGKTIRGQESSRIKPAPYDYQNKSYNILKYHWDRTTSRLDDNSKIIVVEGPLAVGKSKFAKILAEELDMIYFPEANLDMLNVNAVGYDLRKLDEQVPETCRTFDVDSFMMNPKHRLAASFQIKQYSIKYSQYIDALAHLLSTGQGVVLDRCVYSDFVFAEAMTANGYMSKPARSAYYESRQCTINELLRPHLVIYLDVPVPKVMDNIKKRNISYEANSRVITPQYLQTMENYYKQNYLKEISKHAELLIYDWSEGGDAEVVVEDIERINFDHFDSQDPKMKDWEHFMEEDWGALRNKYADQKDYLMEYLCVPRYDVPEFITPAEDIAAYRDVLSGTPGEGYMKGYDPTMGDTGLLFKTGLPHRNTLPLRPRRNPDGTINNVLCY